MQIAGFIERFSEKDTLTVVDPAMADNGKLYPAFDSDFPMAMAEVCRRADVILPNITEASSHILQSIVNSPITVRGIYLRLQ